MIAHVVVGNVARHLVRSQLKHGLVTGTLALCAWVASMAAGTADDGREYQVALAVALLLFSSLVIGIEVWRRRPARQAWRTPQSTPRPTRVRDLAAEDAAKVARGVSLDLARRLFDSQVQAIAQLGFVAALVQLYTVYVAGPLDAAEAATFGVAASILAALTAAGVALAVHGWRTDDRDAVTAGALACVLPLLALVATVVTAVIRAVPWPDTGWAVGDGPGWSYALTTGVLLGLATALVVAAAPWEVRRRIADSSIPLAMLGLLLAVGYGAYYVLIERGVAGAAVGGLVGMITSHPWLTWLVLAGAVMLSAVALDANGHDSGEVLFVVGVVALLAEAVTKAAVAGWFTAAFTWPVDTASAHPWLTWLALAGGVTLIALLCEAAAAAGRDPYAAFQTAVLQEVIRRAMIAEFMNTGSISHYGHMRVGGPSLARIFIALGSVALATEGVVKLIVVLA